LPAPIVNGGGDSLWKWLDFRLSRAYDLDFDLGSGHTAYRHASLIDLYLHTEFHWNRRNISADGRVDGHLRPTLLGRLGGVDLKWHQLDWTVHSYTTLQLQCPINRIPFSNKWSKNLDDRLHRRGGGRFFMAGENSRNTSRAGALLPSSAIQLPLLLIFLAAWNVATLIPMLCNQSINHLIICYGTHIQRSEALHNRLDNPTSPLSIGGSGPHLAHGSLDSHESAPKMTFRSVHPLLHSTPMCPIHRPCYMSYLSQ